MKIIDSITNILRKVQHIVTTNRELQVEQKRDRFGHRYWLIYDANTSKSYTFGSERDAIVWIENRHHSF